MQYDICHPYILTEIKSRISFQNGFQTEEAIISNLKEQFLEMFTETYLWYHKTWHTSKIGLSHPFAPLEDKNNNEFVKNELKYRKSYSQKADVMWFLNLIIARQLWQLWLTPTRCHFECLSDTKCEKLHAIFWPFTSNTVILFVMKIVSNHISLRDILQY